MAKKWKEVTANPEFQALPPDKQEQIRQQYFDAVVAPNVPEASRGAAKQQFDAATGPKPRVNIPAEVAKRSGYVTDALSAVPDYAAKLAETFSDPMASETSVQGARQQMAEMGQHAGAMVDRGRAQVMGRDPDADYRSGLPFAHEIAYRRAADNPEAKKAALLRSYPASWIKQDKAGNYLVYRPDVGRYVAAGTEGGVSGVMEELAANPEVVAGSLIAPEVAGGIAPALGRYAISRMAASAAGSGLGSLVQSGSTALGGTGPRSFGEAASTAGRQALGGALGEGMGMAGGKVFNTLAKGGLPSAITGMTPESRRLAEMLYGAGGSAPYASAAPGMRSLAWDTSLMENLVGKENSQTNANRLAIIRLIAGRLKQSGVPENRLEEATRRVLTGQVPGETLGQDVKQAVQRFGAEQAEGAATARGVAERMIQQDEAALGKGRSPVDRSDLAEAFTKDAIAARSAVSQEMAPRFAANDAKAGGPNIAPTNASKVAADVLSALPKGKDGQPIFATAEREGAVLKTLQNLAGVGGTAEGEAPHLFSLSDMARIHSVLQQWGTSRDLVPGVSSHIFRKMARAVEEDIDAAGANGSLNPAVLAERKALLGQWKNEMARFDNAIIRRLTRAPGEAGYVKPEQFVDVALRYPSQAERVLALATPETRKNFSDAMFQDLIEEARDPSTGKLRGANLLRAYRRIEPMAGQMFGKDAPRLKQMVERVGMRDGVIEIPKDGIGKDAFVDRLAEATAHEQKLSMMKESDLFGQLLRPDFSESLVFDHLVRGGDTARLERAMDFLEKRDKPTADALRTYALQHYLSKAFAEDVSGKRAMSGATLYAEMNRLSPRQQELLLPGGAQGLRDIAGAMELAFPSTGRNDVGAVLAAASIKAHLPVTALKWGKAVTVGWLINHPSVSRYLLLGLKGNERAREIADRSMAAWVKGAAQPVIEPWSRFVRDPTVWNLLSAPTKTALMSVGIGLKAAVSKTARRSYDAANRTLLEQHYRKPVEQETPLENSDR